MKIQCPLSETFPLGKESNSLFCINNYYLKSESEVSELGHFLLKWITTALNGREHLLTLLKNFHVVFPFSIYHLPLISNWNNFNVNKWP